MRAIRDIMLTPFRVREVAKYTAAGQYELSLSAGIYRVALIGAGGGAATCGFTSSTATDGTKTGKWACATGGGGSIIKFDIVFNTGTAVQVEVGAGTLGSHNDKVFDGAPTDDPFANIGQAGNTLITFGGLDAGGEGGNKVHAIVQTSVSAGNPSARQGGGATSWIDHAGSAMLNFDFKSGTTGDNSIFTSLQSGISQTISGGIGGNDKSEGLHIPELVGAGNGGNCIVAYTQGSSPTVYGEDGHDGGAVIWRIG